MPTKYKPILKDHKELFNKIYNTVHDPNKTRFENNKKTISEFGRLLAGYEKTEDRKISQLTAVGLKALIDEMNGEIVHYFISDKNLLQFLGETEIKDTSIVKEYIYENQTSLNQEANYYSIALHTEDTGIVFTYLTNKENVVICVFDNSHTFDFALGAKVQHPLCKMAINLIYYLKCFPEKILDGVPQDMVKNDKKKYSNIKSYSIGIADEIVEKSEYVNGHLVSPHFRSGFFRHYTDDRYVNMKGKVQFIAATMVKGKAKTVVV